MVNWDGKDKDLLALIKYIADEDKLEKVLENPLVIKTPVVRSGKQSTLGYQQISGKDGTCGNDTNRITYVKPPLKWHENFLLHKRFFSCL